MSAQAGLVLAVVSLWPLTQAGAQQNSFHTSTQSLRADSNLVLIPVVVTDRKGASIPDLRPENFQLLDEKNPRPIASFHFQGAPCSVGIVLDTSGSMQPTLGAAKQGVSAFLKDSNAQDEVA